MTRILLLSDTHNFLDEKIRSYAEPCDQIWHAGDIGTAQLAEALNRIRPLTAVYGNIDGMDVRKQYPLHQRFRCEEVDVWMTHIGGKPPGYTQEIRNVLQANPPRLFICGHSHILKVQFDRKYKFLYMNPGAAGNYGFHKVKTLLRFTIDKADIRDLEVVEFGRL